MSMHIMRFLKNSNGMQEALRNIVKPVKIAVAYIRNDYGEFVNTEVIETIETPPSIGSNTRAVGNLVKKLSGTKYIS